MLRWKTKKGTLRAQASGFLYVIDKNSKDRVTWRWKDPTGNWIDGKLVDTIDEAKQYCETLAEVHTAAAEKEHDFLQRRRDWAAQEANKPKFERNLSKLFSLWPRMNSLERAWVRAQFPEYLIKELERAEKENSPRRE